MSKVARDETLQEIRACITQISNAVIGANRASALATGDKDIIDSCFRELVLKAENVQQVNALFIDWWTAQWDDLTCTYNGMLWRWFDKVLDDNRVHGVRFPLFGTSQSSIGELTDDSEGLVCVPSTASVAGQDDFAKLPQFWCVEVAAEKNEDGTHTIYACQYIDDDDLVRGSRHLTWVLQKNTYTRERNEGGYRVLKMRCRKSAGYNTWPQGTDRNGTVYPYIANPKYAAGLYEDGTIGCATGLPPVNYKSHNQMVQLWKQRGSQYAGASGNLLKWQLRMIWLKYAVKGNSGTIEGCSSYNVQYHAAVSLPETDHFPLTAAQAQNFLIGSWVGIGTDGDLATDRGAADVHDIFTAVRITAIEDARTEDGTAYKAVRVDGGGKTWECIESQTIIETMPYGSGYNDDVRGNDGSRTNPAGSKEPGLIQKTEFQNGAYLVIADELWQWGKDDAGNYTFDIYTCHDQSKITTNGTISADYTKQTDLTLRYPADQVSQWQYIEDTAVSADPGVLWPAATSTKAGSGTGVKAGFSVYPAASGVRAAWRCCYLNFGGYAGLAAAYSYVGASSAHWIGAAGAPGLAG